MLVMSTRLTQAAVGYIALFALVIAGLFLLEFILEVGTSFFTQLLMWFAAGIGLTLGIPTTWDFPGPLNVLNFLIGNFPSFWDIGTTMFWGTVEELAFLVYVVLSIASAIFFEWVIITNLRDRFKTISENAGLKAAAKARMETYKSADQKEW